MGLNRACILSDLSSIRMFDHRKLTSRGIRYPLQISKGCSDAILCVQWCPDKSSVFGSGAEDGILNIWDYEKAILIGLNKYGKGDWRCISRHYVPQLKLLAKHRSTFDNKTICLQWINIDPASMTFSVSILPPLIPCLQSMPSILIISQTWKTENFSPLANILPISSNKFELSFNGEFDDFVNFRNPMCPPNETSSLTVLVHKLLFLYVNSKHK
ncbi:unnamed protein product [Fraxinus pennsylvanica]|uniref:Uncharacterized protein n=1 Tax=Fraxinus pennsylvanica TaxID=56036 RepID=A0AAD2AEI8_9LAMI|nr:unnamed protein product [Fraxinus pennsylvanica]